MTRTGSSSTETVASSSSLASPSSASNNDRNGSDPSRPPSGVVMASASASAAVAAAAASSSSISLSDLVPLSMSVLRDKMMADLITESKQKDEQLQQLKQDRLRVEITGRHGDPKYYEASMKDGVSVTRTDGRSFWDVIFGDDDADNTNTIIPNFIETVAGLEVRVGGIVAFQFNGAIFQTFSENTGFDRTRDDTPQMGFICFFNDYDVVVLGRVGPILYEDYINLTHSIIHVKVTELVRFLKDHQTNNNNDTVLLPQLKIEKVHFLKSQIPGVLSLLEDTTGGRSTSE